MEENQSKKIKEFVLPFAIFGGVGRVFIDFIPKVLNASPILYYSSFLICFIAEIILIWYVIKKFKNFTGVLSVKQCILIGVTIMVVIGTLYGFSSYAYDKFLDPNFQVNTMIKWGQMWGGGAEQEIMKRLKENPPNPKISGVFFTILWFSFLGLVISFIQGSIMKKLKTEY